MSLVFAWDPRKSALNRAKHSVSLLCVSFDEAITVFRDPLARMFDDLVHSSEEDRQIIIGHSEKNRLLLVCFVERGSVIRIISARKTSKVERQDYEENE